VKLGDASWPNSPLVSVLGRKGRDGDKNRFTWDDPDECFLPTILVNGDTFTFDVQFESDSTAGDSTFNILVERLDRSGDVIGVIQDSDAYYCDNGQTRNYTISVPIIDDSNLIRFKVEIKNLMDRSMSGTVNWYPSQSKIYGALGIGDPSTGSSCFNCFIATAAYGSVMAPPVQFLREFRDNTVLKSRYSRFFEKILDVYYIFSPPIAKAMMEHKALKYGIKYVIVWPFVKVTQACAIIIDLFTKKT